LGAGHATVHAARTRITAIELQIAVAADAAAVAAARGARGAMPTPAWIKTVPDAPAPAPPIVAEPPAVAEPAVAPAPPANPDELVFIYKPEPRVRRPVPPPPRPSSPGPPASPAREHPKTPRVSAEVMAASSMAAPMELLPLGEMVLAPKSAHAPAKVDGRASRTVHRRSVVADVAHREVESGDAALGRRRSTIAPLRADSHPPTRRKRTMLYASAAGVAAVAIAVTGVMLRPNAGGGSSPVSAEASAARATTAGAAPVMTSAATGSHATGAARTDTQRSVGATPPATGPMVMAARRAPEEAPDPDVPIAPRVPFRHLNVKMPTLAPTNIDSLMRSSSARRGSLTDKLGPGVERAMLGNVDKEVTPPKIVGRAPVPRFPDALRSMLARGEVIVRFKVGEDGAIDTRSMTVVRSDHELFTAAVREVIADFTFEPARTPAPQSKPIAMWVTLPFQFSAKQ
jgi:TonB family protein